MTGISGSRIVRRVRRGNQGGIRPPARPAVSAGECLIQYWLRTVSYRSWQSFLTGDRSLVALRSEFASRVRKIQDGDVLVCYLLRFKRWVGALRVIQTPNVCVSGHAADDAGPCRIKVATLVVLPADLGVEMDTPKGMVSFHRQEGKPGCWIAFVRRSLRSIKPRDGEALMNALHHALQNPRPVPIDPRLTPRPPEVMQVRTRGNHETKPVVVAIPARESPCDNADASHCTHAEIQSRILAIGMNLGLEAWAPKADRAKLSLQEHISADKILLPSLPALFNLNAPLRRTIENIDCLWLQDNVIVAAFEVEHTTSIYSGLLRLCDLIAISPMIRIKLYLVAPDERFSSFARQIARPTFALCRPPLHSACRFLPYSTLCARIDDLGGLTQFVAPDFLEGIAISCDPADDPGD